MTAEEVIAREQRLAAIMKEFSDNHWNYPDHYKMVNEIDRLRELLAAAERNATRYRYIREYMVSAEWYIPFMRDDVWVRLKAFDRREAYYSTLDEAIDALATLTTTEDA